MDKSYQEQGPFNLIHLDGRINQFKRTGKEYIMPGGPYATRHEAANAAANFINARKLSSYKIVPVTDKA